MKILLQKENGLNLIKLIRRCGYREIKDKKTGQISFVHRVGLYSYPRFHLYLQKETPKEIIFNLHLDQKKPSYVGSPAHSAEYNTETVKREVKRIKEEIKKQLTEIK
ncbi:MAG: hypothetical protein N2259_00775 [Patescibacteria group bacterium]|nr:hypothetical protein [Patescibacteria group bacterium]